ncbi:MAG: glutamate-5-semialdehyde dehydrogenase [Acidobacteriia bacterium]|nr:glutamate-5-semialdehyde dehydrogenase [Terriglobia bacterium]
MSTSPKAALTVAEAVARARTAALRLAVLSDDLRRAALLAAADALQLRSPEILAANERDCAAAEQLTEGQRLSPAMFKRLQVDERGTAAMAAQVREVAALPDPLGRELGITALDDDLTLHKVTCPLGVAAIIFESRPDVIPQVAALALRSGNAVLLKGGREAEQTNTALVAIWCDALAQFPEIPANAITLLHTRQDIEELLRLDDGIDLIIPRGSEQFVRYIKAHSRVPVLGHGAGICHVYVDGAADLKKAVDVAFDSKVQYPAACNAAETLLIHQDVAAAFLPEMLARFEAAGVEVRGCPRTQALSGGRPVLPATEADWSTEYSDLIISIKIVGSFEEAVEHVNRWGSKHTESIVTEDAKAAAEFMLRVDAAGVYHNVSTRFADGFRYGLGAELGISTGKLHARGPVGLEGLTTYKYRLVGNGHTVASYIAGERTFKHRPLK